MSVFSFINKAVFSGALLDQCDQPLAYLCQCFDIGGTGLCKNEGLEILKNLGFMFF